MTLRVSAGHSEREGHFVQSVCGRDLEDVLLVEDEVADIGTLLEPGSASFLHLIVADEQHFDVGRQNGQV